MEIQVENSVDIEPVTDVEVAASNVAEVSVADDTALDVSVVKKEYKIVGDEVYIAKLYEDAPQWMKDLVQLVVDNTMASESTALLNSLVSQLNQFAVSYVPLNTYTQSILDLSNADTAMHNTIETLNSNFNDGLNEANSQIIDLQSTKASKTEVAAKVIETITAQLALPTSDIGATIANLQQAIVNGDSANADSITTLTSALEGEVDARATAVSALDTRVTATETAITAQATDITALTTELDNGTNTWAAADSQVTNSLTTKIENDVASVESKWEYNSVVGINGVYKRSGFGLTTNYSGGSGTKVDPYTSEFWIDATKLKFTNSAATGRTAPFTIDASGVTPQITFNGKVSFSNVTGAPGGGSNLLYNSAPMIANETKGWSVGWYNTGIAPVLGAGFDPWRPSGGGSVYAVVPGAPTIGGLFDLAQTTKVPVIGGTWYEASAYISSHRCTSYVTIAWYDSNNTYITEVGGSQTAIASGGALSNWNRSTLLAQAPANAARAHFYVRSAVSGTDPYCFVAFAYLGKAVQGQAVFSDWSEGTSAGVSSGEVVNDINNGNTTTINGGRITTGSITANQINVNDVFSKNITYTGVITGGNQAGGGIIKSYNGKMVIDLVNGSIYIA